MKERTLQYGDSMRPTLSELSLKNAKVKKKNGQKSVPQNLIHPLAKVPSRIQGLDNVLQGGFPKARSTQPPFQPFYDGKLIANQDLPMQIAAKTGKPVLNSEMELRFADGRKIYIFGNAAPLIDRQGHVQGSVGAYIDITARKRIEGALREARKLAEERARHMDLINKELESFSYSIAHDLRAPLRSINGFSTALREDYSEKLDEQGTRYLERIQRNATNMGDLIDDLLRLAKISQSELNLQSVNLSQLSERIIDFMREADPARDITVNIEKNLTARADPNLLEALLKNLLSNAWKFTGKTKNPVITIGKTSVDGKAVFYVKDNGVGFDQAHADKLFKAFARLHGTEYSGTGIGLAIADRIISRHHGSIWAEGKVGEGATFYFSFRT